MKKIIIAAMAAAFTMISCTKEQLVESGNNTTGNECIITAYTEDNLTKTSLSGDDSKGYDVVWSEGDKLKIGDNIFELTDGEGTTKGTFRGTLPKDGTYTAYYPATFAEDGWTVVQSYAEGNITGSPMKADVIISDGKVTGPLSFKNAGGILRLTIKGNATVRQITCSGADVDINLACGAGVQLNDKDGKVFYLAAPAGEFPEAGFNFYFNDGNSINKKMKSGSTLVIERSKITKVSISGINSTGPIDMLPGVFRVAEDRKVRFSKGNLRYTVDSKKWSFYDKQYNCGPLDIVDDKDISLFTWGYNATKSILPYGNNHDNVRRTTGDLEQAEDWGCTIGDGYTWRTLTNAEWQYLFKTRPDAKQKYCLATVNGVYGLIILPDVFIDPMTNGGSGAFRPFTSTGWNRNVYTGGDWDAMEYAGAVFLPHAGMREGEETWTQASYYWSSSAYPDQYSDNAYVINFWEYGCLTEEYQGRRCGCSVRLVTDTDASYTYSVTFDSNGKTASGMPETIKRIAYGAAIAEPSTNPTVEGYIFTGWYKDKKCTTPWNFDSDVVTRHTTLYAGWAEIALSGKFTVNSSGKQVYFSKGNLWADDSNALHFEDNQYGFNNKYERSHVSHFTWASSVSGAVEATGSKDALFCDERHKVSVSNSGPAYYALSKDEWEYLFTGAGRDGKYVVDITYGGVKGVLLYPDNNKQSMLDPGTVIKSDAEFPAGGCVFLPAAGWRDGTVVNNNHTVRSYGYYWSSSATDKFNPYSLNFFCGSASSAGIDYASGIVLLGESSDHGVVYISEPGSRDNAMSLRLVMDVE